MSTDKSQNADKEPTSDEAPAIFATIHHKSEQRPDGYTPEELSELNRLANGLDQKQSKKPKTLLIASLTVLATTLIVTGSVWAMKNNAENKARAAREALALASPPPPIPQPPQNNSNSLDALEVYFTPAQATVRGFFIGQDKQAARLAAEERDMIVYELTEHRDNFYSYSPSCVEQIETSKRGPFWNCQEAGGAIYENGTIKRFHLTPAAFGIERISLHEFVQAITDNFQVSDFRLESDTKLVEGRRVGQFEWVPCEAYVGSLASGTKVEVSACGFGVLSAKFEASPTDNAKFD